MTSLTAEGAKLNYFSSHSITNILYYLEFLKSIADKPQLI